MSARLLIDTDPGIDDALALLLALGTGATVEAITTVAGNVPVERATENVFRVLDAATPRSRPRVAQGAPAPLKRPLTTAGHVHGEDGLGDLGQFREPDGRPRYPSPARSLEMRDAADVILEAAARVGRDLAIVALAPLTNLALALERDAAALRRAGRVVVMGGAVGVPGNVTPAAEFNFYVDPEAAAAVLGAGLPIELVPLDVTRQVVLEPGALEARLRQSPGRLARFLADFTAYAFERWEGVVLHDPLAVGVALDPSLVGFEALHVAVECEGSLTRGLTLADRRPITPARKAAPNCRVATSVEAARFLAFFLERLCPASA
jgi:purine nucleosidase/pyrimidine-specific ribonucleoside hydrolase